MAKYMVLSEDLELVTVLELPYDLVEGLRSQRVECIRIPLLRPVEPMIQDDPPMNVELSTVTLRIRTMHNEKVSAVFLSVDPANEPAAMELVATFAPGQVNTLRVQQELNEKVIEAMMRRSGWR